MVGIISNPAAMQAQSNLQRASDSSASGIAKLSSGNKIIKASDDVAALAVGTILQTNVSTLRSALGNASQASSVLGVIDGGLKSISDILQRMKTLTSTAASGSLTTETRVFVNQEFQQLATQIDDISSSTDFNGKKLLNGDIFAPSVLSTKTQTQGEGAATQGSGILKLTAVLTNGQGVAINGVTFSGRDAADGYLSNQLLKINTGAGATIADQTTELLNNYRAIIGYTGDNQGIIDAQNKLRQVTLESTDNNDEIKITARSAGVIGGDIKVGGSGNVAAGTLTLNSNNVGNALTSLDTSAKNGALNSGMSENLLASGTVHIGATTVLAAADTFEIGTGLAITAQTTLTAGEAGWREFVVNTTASQAGAEENAQRITNALNNLKSYHGTDATNLTAAAEARKFDFVAEGSSIKIIAKDQTTGSNNISIEATVAGTSDFNIDGQAMASGTAYNLAAAERGTFLSPTSLELGKIEGYKASGSLVIEGGTTTANLFAAGDTVNINDATFTFSAAPTTELEVAIGASGADQAFNLKSKIDAVLSYTGTTQSILDAKEKLENLEFVQINEFLRITSKKAGADGNDINVAVTTAAATADISINGDTFTGGTTSTKQLATTSRGTYVYDRGRTFAKGVTKDEILKDINHDSSKTTTGVDVSGIANNAGFVGKINHLTGARSSGENRMNLNLDIGGVVYSAANIVTNPTDDTKATFTSEAGGYFILEMDGGKGVTVNSDKSASEFVTRMNDALSGVTIYQRREIDNYAPSGEVIVDGETESTGSLRGTQFDIEVADYSSIQVEDIKFTAPPVGASNATISMVINGESFSNNFLGREINADTRIVLASEDDPLKKVYFYNGDSILKLDTALRADAAEKAFKGAFGVGEGSSGIAFQVGVNSSETIEISIEDAGTGNIFKNNLGQSIDIDVTNVENSQEAGDVITNAINKIVSFRATVGALQSRFGYVSSYLDTSIQNQDSARSSLLDADIAATSSDFSNSQVRVQASVSVLAQANQLAQNLLKLIG